MDLFVWVLRVSVPYLILITCVLTFFVLYKWAKKRKAAAIGIGMMMHAIMPVPNADKAIQQVVEEKQVERKVTKQNKEGRPK